MLEFFFSRAVQYVPHPESQRQPSLLQVDWVLRCYLSGTWWAGPDKSRLSSDGKKMRIRSCWSFYQLTPSVAMAAHFNPSDGWDDQGMIKNHPARTLRHIPSVSLWDITDTSFHLCVLHCTVSTDMGKYMALNFPCICFWKKKHFILIRVIAIHLNN